MNRILKKLRKAKEGVSEIIANILVLAITVTLFSSIMWYVGTMPAPMEEVYGDFDGKLTFSDGSVMIEILHKSGPTLKDYRTDIYLIIDGEPHTLHIRDGKINGVSKQEWKIGESWIYDASSLGIGIYSDVSVMIVDPTVNSLIWQTTLLGAEGKNPPVVLNKWVNVRTDSVWVQTSTVLQTQSIIVFAKVVDIDGDVNRVYANVSNLNITKNVGYGKGVFNLSDDNNDGVYSSAYWSLQVPIADNLGEKIVRIIAEDKGGRKSESLLKITVQSYTTGPPTIIYAAAEPSSSLLGSSFLIKCYITDPNGNLNKSSIIVANEDNLKTFGTVDTFRLIPSSFEASNNVDRTNEQTLRYDDGIFFSVPRGGYFNVTSWSPVTPGDMTGKNFVAVVLKARYYTSGDFDDDKIPILSVNGGQDGLPILEWTTPITRVFNLMALHYDTVEKLIGLKIVFHNEGNGPVYFDYWGVEITYSETSLSAVQMLTEDPYNPGFFVGYGVASFEGSGQSRTFYYRISANDETGNEASVRISHTVFTSEPVSGWGYGRGEPPGNLNYSALQGFNVFELSDWTKKNYSATPRTIFNQNEKAVVVVASKYLVNTENENTLLVIDPTTKAKITAVSSPNVVFDRYDYNSGYYVYNATIDCSKLQNNKKYHVQVQLRDTWVPNNIFFATTMITIGTADYPKFMTFKDPGYTQPCDEFTTYDTSNNIIYVEIQNRYGGLWYQYGGDVEIRDFFWNAQIKRTPPTSGWNGPVSAVITIDSSNIYRFAINLANATEGSPWIPGENAYVLRYDMFKAGNETYVLSKVITITAPKFKMDFVIGTTPPSGSSWSQSWSMFFYKNDNNWSPPDRLEGVMEGKSPLYLVPFVRTADMNNDGRNDIVAIVAQYKSNPNNIDMYWIWLYINDGYWTKYTIANLSANTPPCQLALGNIDFDNDIDVIIGLLTKQSNPPQYSVYLYRNDGLWTRSVIATSLSSSITALQVGDLDVSTAPGNDPNRSLDVVIGCQDGTVQIYKNADGIGTSWTRYIRSGTSSDVVDFATSDIPVYGTISGQPTGTYLDTRNSFYDPGVFERLYENWRWRYEESNPSEKDPVKDTTGDVVAQLAPNDGEVYTVGYGTTAYITGWDPSGLVDDVEIERVVFKVRYETYNYDSSIASDFILYGTGSGDPTNPMIKIENSGGLGSWIEAEYDLTSAFRWASALINLKVSFTNTYFSMPASSVNFDYWLLNVTWKTGEKLEHMWTIEVTPGSSHTFKLYASRSSSPDMDNFVFSYSIDGVNFVAMPSVAVSSTSATLYTGTLPLAVSGMIYIKVEDSNRQITTSFLDYVDIFMMYVMTTAPGGSLGKEIKGISIADMNGDGSNDLVVIAKGNNGGSVWIGLNNDGSILANLLPVILENANLLDCVGVGTGLFLGGNTLTDIAIAAGSKVYFVEQTMANTYALSSKTFEVSGTISRMVTGDIDGNMRTDVLLVTSDGKVLFYSNYLGTTSGWQIYLIDSIGCKINDLGLGKLQNF